MSMVKNPGKTAESGEFPDPFEIEVIEAEIPEHEVVLDGMSLYTNAQLMWYRYTQPELLVQDAFKPAKRDVLNHEISMFEVMSGALMHTQEDVPREPEMTEDWPHYSGN